MKKLYTRLITKNDIEDTFGYPLENMVNQGAFASKNLAIDNWLDEACEMVNDLILQNRGKDYTKLLNDYIADEANNESDIYEGMYWAQMYQMRFIIDNGNIKANANINEQKKAYDDQVINILLRYGILGGGY